jgi:hypothetical protein
MPTLNEVPEVAKLLATIQPRRARVPRRPRRHPAPRPQPRRPRLAHAGGPHPTLSPPGRG